MRKVRIVAVNLLVFGLLLGAMEVAARLYVAWTRGSQTAGLRERTVNLSYEPFVMYGPGWDQALVPARWPRLPNSCRVFLVGGSVAAGFPEEILEQALIRQIPTRTFQVINGAYGGYAARQELVVASIWGAALRPDILVSLDGANDLAHRLRVPVAGTFYLNPAYDLYLRRPLLAPFAYLMSYSQLYNGIARLVQRNTVGPPDQYADAIPVYVDAQHNLNVIAKGMGAARLMVLQPFSAFKTPQSPEEAAFTLYKYREEIVKALYERTTAQLEALARQDEVGYLDARHIYDNRAEHIFLDDVHLTPLGYQELAVAIGRQIAILNAPCAR